jgi:hypothetical protein
VQEKCTHTFAHIQKIKGTSNIVPQHMKTLINITWGQKNMVILLRIIFFQVFVLVSTGDNKN